MRFKKSLEGPYPLKHRRDGSPYAWAVGLIWAAVLLLAVSSSYPVPASSSDSRHTATTAPAKPLTPEQKIVHLLNRIGFGPRPGDVERVRQIGVEQYLDRQLHPERIPDVALRSKLERFASLKMSPMELAEKYPQAGQVARTLGLRGQAPALDPGPANSAKSKDDPAPADASAQAMRRQLRAYYEKNGLKPPQALLQDLQGQKLVRAVESERQLNEVMVDFWLNHFNVFWNKGADKWLLTDYEQQVIRPHVMGKFEDLLMATAKSPAMLFYLDNYLSSSPNARPPDRPNKRKMAARPANPAPPKRTPGINENYARELMELHTMGVNGGYTQKDVQEVARCFTGWTVERPKQGNGFIFRERMHDPGEKVVLGHRIHAGGIKDGEAVIRLLAHHPSTARFISTKLVQRFVSDAPPPALVERAAQVFLKSDGDLRAVLRTILTSPEFYSPGAYRAKVKSPLEAVASAVRALGGDGDGSGALAQWVARVGEPLYQCQPPTGYPDRADYWVNTGALLERMNFSLALVGHRIAGTRVDMARVTDGLAALPPERAVDRLAGSLHVELSPSARALLLRQLGGATGQTTSDAQDAQSGPAAGAAAVKLVGLILGSPDFQRR